MEEFGIETLKEIIHDIAVLGMDIDSKLSDDGKIDWTEALSIVFSAGPKAFKYVGKAEVIKEEFKDLSSEELEEISEHLANTLDLREDAIEYVIEAGVEALTSIYNLVLSIKEAKPEE